MIKNDQLFPKHLPHHFLVGAGSNIEPHKNIGLALKELLVLSNTFAMSPIIQTDPVGMQSERKFFNFVLYFPSNLKLNELKERFNSIETKLGRNKSDPFCKIKDRPIDLDIITEVSNETNWPAVIKTSESYYFKPMKALLQSLKLVPQSISPLIEVVNINFDFPYTKIGQEAVLLVGK